MSELKKASRLLIEYIKYGLINQYCGLKCFLSFYEHLKKYQIIKILNGKNSKGDCAMSISAKKNNLELMKLLQENGANVNIFYDKDNKPLVKLAILNKNEKMFTFIKANKKFVKETIPIKSFKRKFSEIYQ